MQKTLLYLLLFISFPAFAVGNNSCTQWLSKPGKKGIVLLAHGANLKPEKMDAIGRELVQKNFAVYRVGFSGHCGDREKYLHIKAEDWLADARNFYVEAKRIADREKKPLYLVAYSFSSLIYLNLENELKFDRRIFLAPGIATHYWYHFIRLLGFLPSWISYPSFSIPEYRENNRTGAATIRATDDLLKNVKNISLDKNGVDTLVMMSAEDQVVSYKGIRSFAERYSWQWDALSCCENTLPGHYHHRIIDEISLGKNEWQRMIKKMTEFLIPLRKQG